MAQIRRRPRLLHRRRPQPLVGAERAGAQTAEQLKVRGLGAPLARRADAVADAVADEIKGDSPEEEASE